MSLNEKNLVSLKEAGEASGYSADYIGQLIRAGKIPGKQVYSNIAWMTTAEAVLAYKNKKKEEKDDWQDNLATKVRKMKMELNVLGLFFKTFKLALPILLAIVICSILLISYIIFLINDSNVGEKEVETEQTENVLTF